MSLLMSMLLGELAHGAVSPYSIHLGVRLDSASHALGGGGQLQFRWQKSPFWGWDVVGRMGYLHRDVSLDWSDDHISIALAFGPSWHMNVSEVLQSYGGIRFLLREERLPVHDEG